MTYLARITRFPIYTPDNIFKLPPSATAATRAEVRCQLPRARRRDEVERDDGEVCYSPLCQRSNDCSRSGKIACHSRTRRIVYMQHQYKISTARNFPLAGVTVQLRTSQERKDLARQDVQETTLTATVFLFTFRRRGRTRKKRSRRRRG